LKKALTLFVLLFVLSSIAFSQTPQYYNFNTAGTGNTIPFGSTGVSGYRSQWLLMPNAYNQPTPVPSGNRITKLYIRGAASSGPIICSNLKIRLGQTADTTFSTSAYTGVLDSVYFKVSDTVTTNSSGYAVFTLQTPYLYNPSMSLVIEISHCGFTGTGFSVYQYTALPNKRTNSPGTTSCVFTYSSTDARTIHSGVDVAPASVFYYNYNNGTVNNSFPLNIANGKMSQTVIPAGTFINPSPAPFGNILKLHFRIAATYPLGPATYSTFKIMLQHVTSEFVTTGSFITGAWDTVFKRDTITLQAAVNTWLEFTLDHPFTYNPAQPLAISMEHCGATGTTTGYSLCYTTSTGNRRIYSSTTGCPHVYSGVSTNIINTGINLVSLTGGVTPASQIPGEYKLGQNYPNPFNPVTKISFDLPKSGPVTLKIYDVVGREMITLVNEVKNAGSYIVDFDGSSFPSGTYFYRLESGGFVSTKKMILIK